MTLGELIDEVVDVGIEAAKKNYKEESDQLKGSIAGFEACRGKNTENLVLLLSEARQESNSAYILNKPNYWYLRCFEAEVEWVCNCVSCVLVNQNIAPLTPSTADAMLLASKITGGDEAEEAVADELRKNMIIFSGTRHGLIQIKQNQEES